MADTMNAVRIHQTGGLEVLQYEGKVPKPQATGANLVVKVAAAGINYIDTYHRSGLYKVDLPAILGREAAGTVEAVGPEAKGVSVGDRVAFCAPASYAEYVVVAAAKAVPVPDGMSLQDAAAVMLQGMTAHYLVTSSYPAKAGDTVLIHAAAGGTGGLAVQIAKLRGATVIATVGTAEKAEIARSLGADHVIIYTQDDFLAEVQRITGGAGVHAVYDGVGKATWEKSMKCLRRRGFLILFGNASGAVPAIDPLLLTRNGSLFMTRPTLADHVATRDELLARATELFGWIANGKLRVRIAQTFPLSNAAGAQELLTSRKAAGKILLVPEQSGEPSAKKPRL